jgi:FAD/FMN-containing dehydrogenase
LWQDAADDTVMEKYVQRLISRAREVAIRHEKFHPFVYMNYASADQDVYQGYKSENVARLKAIQKSIDPKGIFTSKGLCNVYFKLS